MHVDETQLDNQEVSRCTNDCSALIRGYSGGACSKSL